MDSRSGAYSFKGLNIPSGIYHRTEEYRKKMSLIMQGKPKIHRLGCACVICKGKRGELKGEDHPVFGKHWKGIPRFKESNPAWKGGLSNNLVYPPEWTEELRESVRERDGRICQMCGKNEQENGQRLDVHHIDGNEDNCDPYNLISLCRTSHGITRGREKYWARVLKEKVKLLRV